MDCLHYLLNLPLSVLINGIHNKQILDQKDFTAANAPMNQTEVAQLISKSRYAAAEGKYELFKTTSHFDTTARHPELAGFGKHTSPEVSS